MKQLRVGVIGCGMVAHVGHLPFLEKNPQCRISALADPDRRNLRRTQRKYRVAHTFEDPTQLLDSELTDAVVVCSPNWAHAEQVVMAAERGLHVLCEKPLATNLEDCDRMARACEKAGVVFQVAFQKRFHSAFQKAREMIERGELGQVYQISVFWNHYIPDLEAPWISIPLRVLEKTGIDLQKKWGAWRLTDARAGGGDFMDHGPHYLDLFRFLLGPYDLISAEMARVFPSRLHEDHALCTVRFASGALGHIERSQNVVSRPYGHEKGAVHGTRGSLYFEVPHEYTLGHARLYRYRLRNTLRDRRIRIRTPGKTSYQRQTDLFVATALGQGSDQVGFPQAWVPSGEDGRFAVESVLAAYLSSASKRKIPFPLSASDRQHVRSLASQPPSFL